MRQTNKIQSTTEENRMNKKYINKNKCQWAGKWHARSVNPIKLFQNNSFIHFP